MTETKEHLLDKAMQMAQELVAIRRQIHKHPELSFKEFKTSATAEKHLVESGFAVRGRIAESGFYADFGENPSVAVRCEMDALPMLELYNAPYSSQVPNVMHGCGHDAHVACVIGTARLVKQIGKPIRIIMQPGEEQPDEAGVSGAKHVLESGALEGITTVVGLHVDPTIKTGRASILPIEPQLEYLFMAEIRGEDMTRSLPELLLSIQAQPEVRLYEVHAVETRVRIAGKLVSHHSEDLDALKRAVAACFSKHDHSIDWRSDTAPTRQVNAAKLVEAAQQVVGEQQATLSKRKTWSSSLTTFSHHVASVLILLGSEMRGDRRSQHTGWFDIDEACLPIGAALIAAIADSI